MKKYFRVLPLIVVCLTNVLFSHQPSPILMDLGFTFEDKLLHISAFFVLGIALLFALSPFKMPKLYRILIVISFGAVWGLLDEVHQSFVPNRTAALDDWIADVIGVILSLLFIRFFFTKEPSNELPTPQN
ncbi:MAG: VanZ family protein [Candidatus Kapabacteria bacterium]|nr:VanZ family protein [Candidatus Kapabacteria bacterium]